MARARQTPAGRGGVEVRNLHASLPPVHALPTKARWGLAPFAPVRAGSRSRPG